jgi:hypothetical protein
MVPSPIISSLARRRTTVKALFIGVGVMVTMVVKHAQFDSNRKRLRAMKVRHRVSFPSEIISVRGTMLIEEHPHWFACAPTHQHISVRKQPAANIDTSSVH